MLRALSLGVRRVPATWLMTYTKQSFPQLPVASCTSRQFSTSIHHVKLAKEGSAKDEGPEDLGEMRKPSNFQKKILVWGKMYKTVEDVPHRVSAVKMKKSQDMFRVRVCILMMAATVIACVIEIIRGRRMRDSGDSLTLRGNAQIEEWKQLGERERENKKELAEFKRKGGAGS